MFFGWFVVVGAFSVLATAYGLQFSYGVFLPAISEDLGWDRSTLSAPFALFVVVYTSFSMVTGRLTDRFGPRGVISLGAIGLALGYGLLGTVSHPWEIYLYLSAIAAVGASVAFVPCNATVIRWFTRRRGLAIGLASCGISAAAAVGPPIAGWLILEIGWRHALYVMALCGGVAVLLAAQGMVRDPESRGLRPDGDDAEAVTPTPAVDGWTLREAQRSRAFWLLLASLIATWLVVFLPFVHLGAYGLDLGLSAMEAAALISAIGFGGLAGRVVAGGLTDRFGRIPGLALALVLQALAFLGFAGSQAYPWLLGWAFAYGIGYSGISVLFPALLGDFFGRAHAGAIAGFVFAIGGVAAAAGPYTAGVVFDRTGDYTVTFVVSSVLNSAALLIIGFVTPPKR